jgi:hypothetical protein
LQGAPPTELLPPAAPQSIDFSEDVEPILAASCARCHGAERPRGGFRLTDRVAAIAGGQGGPAIIPGDSGNSPLIHYVARLVEGMEMPPTGAGDPLSEEQVAVLRAWIDQGARWPEATAESQRVVEIVPMVQAISVEGNERKFREDYWLSEGWSGGLERFAWREALQAGSELAVEGRGIFGQEDYGLALELLKRDLGFLRLGVDTRRKYFNDVGGVYAPWDVPPLRLDRDLTLDVTRSWVEFGLARPGLPFLTLGYHHELREGERATLQWGQVTPDPFSLPPKAVAPNAKIVHEEVHRLRFDAQYDLEGFSLENDFLAEWAQLETSRANRGSGAPDLRADVRDELDEFQLANTFRVEKQVRPGWLVAGGCLFTQRDGAEAFDQMFSSLSSAFPPFPGDRSDSIVLELRAHAANLSTQVQPWRPLTFWAGLQAEAQRQDGFTSLVVPGFPTAVPGQFVSDLDRSRLDQTAGLRFDGLPYTVIEADARWRQEWMDQAERGIVDDGFDDRRDFLRDTDATGRSQDYQAGFTLSPWPRLSVGSGVRYRVQDYGYDHGVDTDGSQPPFGLSGNGYPAFIQARGVTGRHWHNRVIWRVAPALKAALKHEWSETRYTSDTDATFLPASPTPIVTPGGELLSGERTDHSYSANLTWTPTRRWYLSGTASFTDADSVSGVTGNSLALAPYSGDVVGLLASSSLRLSAKSDLTASYVFSRADYRQDNAAEGLPLGLQYDRHGVTASLTRRWHDRLSTRLFYGFYDYREATAAGANDYQAHAVAVSLQYTFSGGQARPR